ncbi:hypothetical protein PWT90_02344 [Aphanocladium album]|nr:hypothetical protein PWT90_02344 [Aphanocladium album]
MCRATLGLCVCKTCQNVDLFMTASEFCPQVMSQPGSVCRSIELRHVQPQCRMNQLPPGECRVCKVAKYGKSGFPPGANRPMRGSPVEPMIEYYVLMRNAAANQSSSGAGPSCHNFREQPNYTGRAESPDDPKPTYEEPDDDDHSDNYPPGTEFIPAEGGNSHHSRGTNSRANPYGRNESSGQSYGRHRGDHSPGPMGRNPRQHSPGPMGRDSRPQASGASGGYSGYQQDPYSPSPFGNPSYRGEYSRDEGRGGRYPRGSGYPPGPGYHGGSGGPYGSGRR